MSARKLYIVLMSGGVYLTTNRTKPWKGNICTLLGPKSEVARYFPQLKGMVVGQSAYLVGRLYDIK